MSPDKSDARDFHIARSLTILHIHSPSWAVPLAAMFVFQLAFVQPCPSIHRRLNNIPFVFNHHCSPFKMKNTRGKRERKDRFQTSRRMATAPRKRRSRLV